MSFSITLPDGSKRDFDKALTVGDLAHNIATSLGKAAVAAKVDGQLEPVDYQLNKNAKVAIITNKDDEALNVLRATAAFLFEAVAKKKLIQSFILVNMLPIRMAFTLILIRLIKLRLVNCHSLKRQ